MIENEYLADEVRAAVRTRELWGELADRAFFCASAVSATEQLTSTSDLRKADTLAGNTPPSFTRQNQTWHIVYGDESAPFPDRAGLRRIHLLLEKQGQEARVEDLIEKQDLSRGERVHDSRSIRDLEENEGRLTDYLDRGEGDLEELEEARELLQKVQSELRSARGPTRKGRRTGDEAKAAADAVAQSIRRAIGMVKETMPKFAEHLRTSIAQSNSMSPAYRPSPPITWIL
jgi:hypothetical protein